jgi:hypothetical protein
MTKKSKPASTTRRQLIALAGASAAGAIAAPYIGGVRRARAARGSAVACIRFYLNGGARTSAMWDANHTAKYNPYGTKYTSPPSGVDQSFFLGSLWPDSMVDVLPDISVVRTMFHGDGIGTSHDACQRRVLMGGTDDNLPGWATVTNRELFAPLPAIQIGDANDAAEALGNLGPTFSSIEIPNARSIDQIRTQFLAGLPSEPEMRRITRLRDLLSRRAVQRTPFEKVRNLPFQQSFTKEIIEQITNGAQFDVSSSGDGANLGRRISDGTQISNGDLRTIFGVSDNGGGNEYGAGAMLGLRLVQSGLRSVTIERGGWDTHGNEATRLGGSLPQLGQAIAGLVSTLKNLESLSGNTASALDDVLIVVDSEFSRDNTGTGGYNGNNGSDHQSTYARYFSVMFAGGGVAGGRAVGGTDANFNPIDGKTFQSSRVNATIYDLLGIASSKYLAQPPIEELYG